MTWCLVTISQRNMVINPGFPEPGYTGNPAVFQTRKPGFWSCSNTGFRVWHFLPIFYANGTFSRPKWIKTAVQRYAALILFALRLAFWFSDYMINILCFLCSYYMAQWCAK